MLKPYEGKYRSLKRNEYLCWAGLVIVSLLLCLVAARYLERIVFSLVIAYAIGGLIHFGLGVTLHYLIIAYRKRESFFGRMFLALFSICLAAIVFVFWARLQDLIARGRDPLTAFLQSFFVMLLEIALPSLFGTALAQYSLKLEEAKEDHDYYQQWLDTMSRATEISIASNEWIEEVVKRLEPGLNSVEQEKLRARGDRDVDRLRRLEEKSRRLAERIREMRTRYPGDFDAALAQWRAIHPQEQQGGEKEGQAQG
jgi:ABC-type multidrug transport system fused ATPase/permease subunit